MSLFSVNNLIGIFITAWNKEIKKLFLIGTRYADNNLELICYINISLVDQLFLYWTSKVI